MRKSDLKRDSNALIVPDSPDVPDDNQNDDLDNNQDDGNFDHTKQSGERWSEQRGPMVWVSLLSTLLLMSGLFFSSPEKIKALIEISQWYFATMGSIVVSYFGVKSLTIFKK